MRHNTPLGHPRPVRPAHLLLAGLALLVSLSQAQAQFTAEPLSFSGNIQTQQIFRHPEVDKWSIVQQRNTVRLRLGVRLDSERPAH